MTKRQAIIAAMGGIIGIMSKQAKSEPVGHSSPGNNAAIPLYVFKQGPQTVTFSLDTYQSFTFTLDGKSVTVSNAEVFEALSQPSEATTNDRR